MNWKFIEFAGKLVNVNYIIWIEVKYQPQNIEFPWAVEAIVSNHGKACRSFLEHCKDHASAQEEFRGLKECLGRFDE